MSLDSLATVTDFVLLKIGGDGCENQYCWYCPYRSTIVTTCTVFWKPDECK